MREGLVTEANRKWWTLGALCFALFMIMLDNTVVNVALTAIERDLGATISELQWVVSGYALAFAVLMLTGGKLADFLGRRRIFLIGLAVFAGTSLACGLATSAELLIAFRAAQGVGAALMMPATLAIITHTFPAQERGTAFGIWAGVSALALAIGPLVGGLLTEHASWHWIFFLNVPIGVAGLAAGRVLLPESRDTSVGQRLDVPGLVVSATALFALTYALTEANRLGWTSPTIIALFVVAALGLVAFVALEHRQRAPMLDLSLFRSGNFAGANVVALLVTLAMFGVFFFMSLYVQQILGYSPVEAGALFLPMTCLIILAAPIAGRLTDSVGPRWLLTLGMTLLGVSLVLFSRLGESASFWDILPGLVVGGLGMGLAMTPMSVAAMGSVPIAKSGVAAGVLNTSRQVGGALGIALMGAIMASRSSEALAGGATPSSAFLAGFERAQLVGAAVVFVGAATAAATIRRIERPPRPDLASATA